MILIQIVNKYKHKPTLNDIYIGRGSLLGNPFSHKENTKALYKVDTVNESIEKYKIWLIENFKNNKEIKNYILSIKEDSELSNINLVCFCKPKACHGDIIKDFIDNLE